MHDCSEALLGPYCADPFGVPRYSSTIWIDFLNGHLATSTRAKYAGAANALYRQAESMVPPIDLDAALLSADLSSLEAVLSASLLICEVFCDVFVPGSLDSGSRFIGLTD